MNSARVQMSRPNRETLWRTLLTFSATRIVIAAVLFLYLFLNLKKDIDPAYTELYWQTCIVYIALAVAFIVAVVRFRRRFLLQLILQVSVDIIAIAILYAAAGGARSGLAILFLFPLAGGAILGPLLWAMFFTSLAALFLLGESIYRTFELSGDASFSQAGLYGAAYFAAVVVVNRLAVKLIAEETLAAQRGLDLHMQQAINRLVIADMGDGILVVDDQGRILNANPAAERIVGMSIAAGEEGVRLRDLPFLAPIAEAYAGWRRNVAMGAAPRHGAEAFVVVKPGVEAVLGAPTAWAGRSDLAVHVRLRFAKVEAQSLPGECSVIFLQDVTEIENQAQQLKLASMGRLTASIAHEVRNPLAAISHAASLLAEDPMDAPQQRLLTIMRDNVERLNRMIEDILKLSRKVQIQHEAIDLRLFLDELLGEFRDTHHVKIDMIDVRGVDGVRVRFDPLHLREVIVNLLTNALRYASAKPGSIRIYALPQPSGRLEIHVQDDGPAITPEVRAHLFEPFYTTSNKGTGLGLYLARELCLNNGAAIDYEYRSDEMIENTGVMSGRFVLTLAMTAG